MNEELLPAQKKKDGKAEVVPMEEKERNDNYEEEYLFIILFLPRTDDKQFYV